MVAGGVMVGDGTMVAVAVGDTNKVTDKVTVPVMSVAATAMESVQWAGESWLRLAKRPDLIKLLYEDNRVMAEANRLLMEPDHLDTCELVYIAPDMVDLVEAASKSLPMFDFDPLALPWPRAYCVLGRPMTVEEDTEAVAMIWSDLTSEMDLIHPETMKISTGSEHSLSQLVGAIVGAPRVRVIEYAAGLKTGMEWDTMTGDGDVGDVTRDGSCIRALCTIWLLLQQRVAVKRSTQAPRSARRRWQRNTNRDIPNVTVIELRRPITTSKESGDALPVDWSHRWLVGGHWRNQYYQSTDEHRPTWIAPYVKGPEDKPLVVKTKINSWVR